MSQRIRDAADAAEWAIDRVLMEKLSTAEERQKARLILKRRLMHPEGRGAIMTGDVHPKQGGATAASSGGPMCVCGRTKGSHDLDGQRNDCDGFVEEKW